MSTTVTYKGTTITTAENQTRTLATSGKWLEADIVITDVTQGGGGTPAISVVDTTDSHGGTVREITALDISDTTAVASDVAQGKYFYTAAGVKTAGTASGGGTPSQTQHTILFEFTDETSTSITAYYDSAFISDAITATTPTTYGSKTVDSASLDGVAWYTRPTETWETIYNSTAEPNADTPYNYWWLSSLSDIYPTLGSVWRVTIDGTSWITTARQDQSVASGAVYIGNPKYSGGQDDGSGMTTDFYNAGWGAWVGDTEISANQQHTVKIERKVSV